ncbi:uncharacterized protein LOC100899041 [Galendromus occidentalis]|uniref:Uncharacterized protein LOC100899041 n=1 Tax=Galendromus occidentalis TaxID=34638 RepID=A0AAJ6QT37_9ACAR|nr:uncharacterized protein LOC100899041 [Galendromus occidentalis]
MSSGTKRKREFPSTFSSESRKFIFQLDLDQDAVKQMLGSLPYAHLRAVLLPLELHGKASYFEEMAEIERRSSCPHYGRYLYDLTSSNKCNIEISACVRLENPEEFYEANGLNLIRGEARNLDRALELETTLSEATVKCDISLNSVQAMNDFYSDYKSGLFDNSFRQAILGSPTEQQNLEPGQPRYSVKVGLNDRIFEAEKDRLQAMENAAKLAKKTHKHRQRQSRPAQAR